MNILIAGAGKVGYNLSKILSKEHNVTVIDNNQDALEKLEENIDVFTIAGDLRNAKVYTHLKEDFDFFIAVTNNDEINIISSLIADNFLSIENKIVRLANIDYINNNFYKNIKIDRLIFPYQLAASAIGKLVSCPKANNIKDFPFMDFKLVSLYVDSDKKLVSEINSDFVYVVGVERDGEFLFLNDEDEILNGDLLYIFGEIQTLKGISKQLNQTSPDKITKALVLGANPLGIEIAKIISSLDIEVKILEKDIELATKATELLEDEVTVINSTYEDEQLFYNESLQYSDIAIAASLKDEENIIKLLQIKKLGIKKQISINNNLNYYSLMHSLNLPTIRGPKIAAYYAILEEIDSRLLIYEKFFLGSKGRILIKRMLDEKSVKPPKDGIAIIVRENNLLIIKEKTLIKQNDIVMLFNLTGKRKWIEAL